MLFHPYRHQKNISCFTSKNYFSRHNFITNSKNLFQTARISSNLYRISKTFYNFISQISSLKSNIDLSQEQKINMANKVQIKSEKDLQSLEDALLTVSYLDGGSQPTKSDFEKAQQWSQLNFIKYESSEEFRTSYPNITRYLTHINNLIHAKEMRDGGLIFSERNFEFGRSSETIKGQEKTNNKGTGSGGKDSKDLDAKEKQRQQQAEKEAKKKEKAAAALPGKGKEFQKGANATGFDVVVVPMKDRKHSMGKQAPALGVLSDNLKTIVHKEPKYKFS